MLEKILEEQPVITGLESADNEDVLTKGELEKTQEKGEDALPQQVLEVLDDIGLNEEQRTEVVKVVKAYSLSEQYSGPIPHPRIMRGYEEICPGAADRILTMAEKEAEHRHSIDDTCVKADSRDSLLGIVSALILGVTTVIGGIVVIIKVPAIAGTISGTLITGAGLGGILGTFLRGTKATWKMGKDE